MFETRSSNEHRDKGRRYLKYTQASCIINDIILYQYVLG